MRQHISREAMNIGRKYSRALYDFIRWAYVDSRRQRYGVLEKEIKKLAEGVGLEYVGAGAFSIAVGNKTHVYKIAVEKLLNDRDYYRYTTDGVDDRTEMMAYALEETLTYVRQEWNNRRNAKREAGRSKLARHILKAKMIWEPWPVMVSERLTPWEQIPGRQRDKLDRKVYSIFDMLGVADSGHFNIGIRDYTGDVVILDYAGHVEYPYY